MLSIIIQFQFMVQCHILMIQKKQNWVIKELGWTIYNNKLNTVGIGRKPFVTYFEALNWIQSIK